jgi:hyperosmotically inducible protein
MRTRIALALSVLLLSAGGVFAQAVERTDLQLFDAVATSVNHYSYFTIFDDVSAEVKDGVVTLEGKVTMPYKRTDLEARVAKVPGVTTVVNRLDVLPVSTMDDRLRARIARAIYGNAHFWNYGAMANPPIHIVVERGRVTLTGVVQDNVERMIARSLVDQPGIFSVTNRLQTTSEARDARDRS